MLKLLKNGVSLHKSIFPSPHVFYLSKILNIWFVFAGFFYANIVLKEQNGVPLNIVRVYLFLVIIPALLLFINYFLLKNKGKKKVEKFTLIKSEWYLSGALFILGSLFSVGLKALFGNVLFGWNLYFDIATTLVSPFIKFASFPWSFYWEGAVPSFELIKLSELKGETSRVIASAKSNSSWWKFLAASIFHYAFLPRFLIFCYQQLKCYKRLPA